MRADPRVEISPGFVLPHRSDHAMTFIEVLVDGEEAVAFSMEFRCDEHGPIVDVRMARSSSALPPVNIGEAVAGIAKGIPGGMNAREDDGR